MLTEELNILNLEENREEVENILSLAEKLQEACSNLGFNPFQPGAIKELKMANILGHNWVKSKKKADACSRSNSDDVYEYLSGTENGSGQIDRFFKDGYGEQHEKHMQSVERITRNKSFYLAFTDRDTSKPLHILRIYEVSPEKILQSAEEQLSKSTNLISHIGFDERFASANGILVYADKPNKS